MNKDILIVLRAMMKDSEVLAGGISDKEEYYMKKYNLTREQVEDCQIAVYGLTHGARIRLEWND